jgi:hypothetical protein
MTDFLNLSVYRVVGFVVVVLCLFSLVDAAIPQFELYLTGHVLIRQSMIKGALLTAVVVSCLAFPRIRLAGFPIIAWLLCIAYLVADIAYLTNVRHMSIDGVLTSYFGYYLLLLVGPALLALRGAASERFVIAATVFLFAICAVFGIAQYLKADPILYTDSVDGALRVDSWEFFGQVRAFSLFTSSMNFGMYCALCGALGVALFRKRRKLGALLFIVAGIACFTTLTRLCYLVFLCVCSYAAVLVFGKRRKRGLWSPLLYFALGMATIIVGLSSFLSGGESNLQDPSSLIQRLSQWAYYFDLLAGASPADLLFGVGIVQNERVLPLYPMIIDNMPLALVLHIGIVGLVLFGVLLVEVWLYLRREALAGQQPFVIAAASLWAALACAGIFNIVFTPFSIVLALAIFCIRSQSVEQRHGFRARPGTKGQLHVHEKSVYRRGLGFALRTIDRDSTGDPGFR